MAGPVLKPVKVKRTVFSKMRNPDNVKILMDSTEAMASKSALYKDPFIPEVFYTDGQTKSAAIGTAKVTYDNAPTTGNHGKWIDAGDDGIEWMGLLADKVEPIANSDVNRTTREQAAINITLANLTPQQLAKVDKGSPDAPQFKLISVASGSIDVGIINGGTYNPSRVMIIAVETLSGATVTLDVTDLVIAFTTAGSVKIKSALGKGALTHFTNLKPGVAYDFYGYAQNGKKQISPMSVKITRTA